MANSHPGSYCGQDAYNNMLVTENDVLRRKWSITSGRAEYEGRSTELYARSANHIRGGWYRHGYFRA